MNGCKLTDQRREIMSFKIGDIIFGVGKKKALRYFMTLIIPERLNRSVIIMFNKVNLRHNIPIIYKRIL